MTRFQRMIDALALMVILIIAMATVSYLLPNRSKQSSGEVTPDTSTNASTAEEETRSLEPVPDPNWQQSRTYRLVAGSVHDGDSLRVTDGAEELRFDCAASMRRRLSSPMGVSARDHLKSLIAKGDGTIVVVPVEQDRYGRTVAELFIKPTAGQGYRAGEEIAVNAQMVRDGYAYHFARYSGGCPNGQVLSGLEAAAQEKRLGVWRDENSVRPWESRRNK